MHSVCIGPFFSAKNHLVLILLGIKKVTLPNEVNGDENLSWGPNSLNGLESYSLQK